MNKTERVHIDDMPTVGYWSCLGGVEVKEIQYGIEDYIVYISNAWNGSRSYHRVKINYDGKRFYITLHGQRLYLDECLRV